MLLSRNILNWDDDQSVKWNRDVLCQETYNMIIALKLGRNYSLTLCVWALLQPNTQLLCFIAPSNINIYIYSYIWHTKNTAMMRVYVTHCGHLENTQSLTQNMKRHIRIPEWRIRYFNVFHTKYSFKKYYNTAVFFVTWVGL